MDIPSTRPFFSEEDTEAISSEVRSILKSGRLVLGPYLQRFEESFRDYCGVKYAVGVSSCTAALEISLHYFNVTGNEVIVPTNTFIATSNAVIYSGGTPILADIKADTLCLDPADLMERITPKTKGVIVVHLAGLICPDIEQIQEICQEKGLFLLEDCAHAHGATINNKKSGSLSQAGCFSFYPTKVMTTCTGGMLTTNDEKLADYAISMRHYGVGKGLHHIVNAGDSWLMDEISALLGIYQLKSLELNLKRRNEIALKYTRALENSTFAQPFEVPANIWHSYYKYPVLLSPGIEKSQLVNKMQNEHGVSIGSIYDPPCHLQPIYQQIFGFRRGAFPVADEILPRTCALPMHPQLTDEEVDYVLQSLLTTLQTVEESLYKV
jgi:perosamine synthetase